MSKTLKRVICLLTISALLFSAGCSSKPQKGDAAAKSGHQVALTTNRTAVGTNTSAENKDIIEITDPDKLHSLWSDYLFDGITTIFNTEFDSPPTINNKFYMIEYAMRRMVKDGDFKHTVSEVGPFKEIEIPSVEEVQKKIKQYFNTDMQFNLHEELEKAYGIPKDGKNINIYNGEGSYNDPNPWGIVLKKVTYNKTQNEYNAELASIANQNTGRVDRITYITLKERDDKSLYFISVKYEYPQTRLVEISGDYLTLAPEDFGAESIVYSAPISIYGSDINGKLLLRGVRQLDKNDPGSAAEITFSIYDPASNKVEHTLEINQTKDKRLLGVRILSDRLVFKMNDSFFETGFDLDKINDSITQLPDIVKKSLTDNEYTDEYDVSEDLKKIVFTDKNGLYIYSLDTGETAKLASHVKVNSKLFDTAYIILPQFSAHDEAVIGKLSSYEGYYGVFALNLQHPDKPYICKNLYMLDGLDYTNIMYPIPDMRFFDEESAEGGETVELQKSFGIEQVDLEALSSPLAEQKQNILQVTFDDEINKQLYASLGNVPVYNDKYLAYIAAKYEQGSQREDVVYNIVRINLQNMKAETLLTIKAGEPYIRAITADGRVMVSYHFERESGLVITGR